MKLFSRNVSLSFDRSFSSGQSKQLLWLVGIMAIVFAMLTSLSYIEFLYAPAADVIPHWYERCRDILLVLIDPGSGSESMSSTFIIICAVVGLIIFTGMLISVISNVLERRVESYEKGETDYNIKNHVVVVGFNKSVPKLLSKIYEANKESYILLMSSRETEYIRDFLHSNLENDCEQNIIIIRGISTAKDDIMRLNLRNNVKEIYVIGEEDDDCHDANNLKCVELISGKLEGRKDVMCYVQIDSDTVYMLLQRVGFAKNITDKLNLQPFNQNEIWAQKVIATVPSDEYSPLDGEGVTAESKKHVHLIIVGFNEMATSIAVNAAHILHFPNFKDGDFSTCSHITFIDKDVLDYGKRFRAQYHNLFELSRWREVAGSECLNPDYGWRDSMSESCSPYSHLGDENFMDIQWEFIGGDVCDEYIQTYLKNCSESQNEITTIALCYDSSELNTALCMALPIEICETANQILVRQKDESTTMDLIRQVPYWDKVRAFGMKTQCYEENLVADEYGKIVNALYSGIALYESDKIDKDWKTRSVLDKWSSIYSANMLYIKLRSLGLDINNMSEELVNDRIKQYEKELQLTEHNRWNTEKLLLGFAPLTKNEQDKFKNENKVLVEYRKELKEKGIKHLDICSNEKLESVDKEVVDKNYDQKVNNRLWNLHQIRMKSSI